MRPRDARRVDVGKDRASEEQGMFAAGEILSHVVEPRAIRTRGDN